jgi:hypothetical protein
MRIRLSMRISIETRTEASRRPADDCPTRGTRPLSGHHGLLAALPDREPFLPFSWSGASFLGQATDGVVFFDANSWLSQNSLSTVFILEGRFDHTTYAGWLFVCQLFTACQPPGIFRLMNRAISLPAGTFPFVRFRNSAKRCLSATAPAFLVLFCLHFFM